MSETVTPMPFRGRWERLGTHLTTKSTDSVVVRLYDPLVPRGGEEYQKPVVKWNRQPIASPEVAIRTARFTLQSLALYRIALGEEHIVPTSVAVGAKRDGEKDKFKVYIFQPYIDGWDGKSLPADMREHPYLVEQWRVLYWRLSKLYTTARLVNRCYPVESPYVFPIRLTVGNSREKAIENGECDNVVPITPNILIDRQNLRISLGDFGRYTPWRDEMEEAYSCIKEDVK